MDLHQAYSSTSHPSSPPSPLSLPIRPSDDSLQSHIQALDLLSAQISKLTTRTRWPAHIPLNSKASFRGSVIHTNDLKVHVGGEWWIEMTAGEAAAYVQRRKQALLLAHARMQEGSRGLASSAGDEKRQTTWQIPLPPPVTFNPLFASPSVAGPSRVPKKQVSPQRKSVSRTEISPRGRTEQPAAQTLEQGVRGTSASLEDVVEDFLKSQRNLAGSEAFKPSSSEPNGSIINEGLPVHEIRENLDGSIIGTVPEPTVNGEVEEVEDEEKDYWSEDAVARRAALRRKIFHEGDDSEDEDEDEDEDENVEAEATADNPRSISPSSMPQLASPRTSSSQITLTTPPLSPNTKQPANSPPAPRSILKPTPLRKKSVSFDDSVPLPPDSPPNGSISGKIGFPLPGSEFSPNPVPVIAEPKPAVKNVVDKQGFAGFRPGFLTKSQTAPPAAVSSNPLDQQPQVQTPGSKKTLSLFAQRMAAQTQSRDAVSAIEKASSTSASTPQEPPPSLPRMSETKPMSFMKQAVVEHQPASSSASNKSTSRAGDPLGTGANDDEVDDVHRDDYDDDDNDDGEEDEYDLDDALLAREVALDYHRRQAYGSVKSFEQIQAEDDMGGVMMALPQISSGGQIINPTPDDLRKYVRVGRLENGNLVLAPGEEGWSDEEDKDVKERREAVKQQLLGGPPVAPRDPQRNTVVENVQLPPVVTVDPVVALRPPAVTAVPGDIPEQPQPGKKVSRFKAARMGL